MGQEEALCLEALAEALPLAETSFLVVATFNWQPPTLAKRGVFFAFSSISLQGDLALALCEDEGAFVGDFALAGGRVLLAA